MVTLRACAARLEKHTELGARGHRTDSAVQLAIPPDVILADRALPRYQGLPAGPG